MLPPDTETLPPPGLSAWLREGLRAGVFLRPRLDVAPTPRQLMGLIVLLGLLEIAVGRLEVEGAARFDLAGWLAPWWGTGALALVLWAVLPVGRVAAWLALWLVAAWPAALVSEALGIAQAYGMLPAALDGASWFAWAVYGLLWGWTLAVGVRLAAHLGAARRHLAAVAAALAMVLGFNAWVFPDRPWRADETVAQQERPRLVLSQEAFEAQQALWDQAVEALAPQRPGRLDVYGIVFAPYAAEDVFLRESNMVTQVLADRFDAQGRILQLVNHPTTAATLPWATPLNLKRAIAAVAQRMDREHDLLVVYLTSHGASDFKLAAEHGTLAVDSVSPAELREALDQAGVRHRVIAVSACYSGGWVAPLAGEGTLVMTAADATHTSYGCGRLSDLTFFGRAVFDEQLRQTRDFESAFAAAVPVIRQREVEAGKPDGFSNPQISVGEHIRPLLRQLAAP